MGYHPLVVLCLPLADLHHFCLTKRFPKTHSAIQPIRTQSAFCIDQIVPGFVVYYLNRIYYSQLHLLTFVLQYGLDVFDKKEFTQNLKQKLRRRQVLIQELRMSFHPACFWQCHLICRRELWGCVQCLRTLKSMDARPVSARYLRYPLKIKAMPK